MNTQAINIDAITVNNAQKVLINRNRAKAILKKVVSFIASLPEGAGHAMRN